MKGTESTVRLDAANATNEQMPEVAAGHPLDSAFSRPLSRHAKSDGAGGFARCSGSQRQRPIWSPPVKQLKKQRDCFKRFRRTTAGCLVSGRWSANMGGTRRQRRLQFLPKPGHPVRCTGRTCTPEEDIEESGPDRGLNQPVETDAPTPT